MEQEKARLAAALRRGGAADGPVDAEEMAACILSAKDLLAACEFALSTLDCLSTPEFAGAGDKLARKRLADAISQAHQIGFWVPGASLEGCRRGIEDSLREAAK